MAATSFVTPALDFAGRDLDDVTFEWITSTVDTCYYVHPLCTIQNDMPPQGLNPDTDAARGSHTTTQGSVGHGGLTERPLHPVSDDAAPHPDTFWGVSFEDGEDEDDMFRTELWLSSGAALFETRQLEAGNDAYDFSYPLCELAQVTVGTDDHPGWDIAPDVRLISLCDWPIDAVGFDDSPRTSEILEVDWDRSWNEFELAHPGPATSSPVQDRGGQSTQHVVIDLTESDTDDEPRTNTQNVRTGSRRHGYYNGPSRNIENPDPNPHATIKSVQLRLGSEVQRFSWKRRDGVWRNQYNSVLDLVGLGNPHVRFSICLELFVYDDGAKVSLVWDQGQQVFIGSDLVACRTFKIGAEWAWSTLGNPDISQPVQWVPAS